MSSDAVNPSNNEDDKKGSLPSPYYHAQAAITQKDGTQWIFYYNIHNHLHYIKIPPEGPSVHVELLIDNKPVIGNPEALAATRHSNSPRLYWIDTDQYLHEALPLGTGDRWASGELSSKKWRTFVNTGLTAEGDNSSLPHGVTLRVLFHESEHFPLFSQADWVGSWKKILLED